MNVIALTGNLGADPELRTTPQGKSVATINLAVRDDFDKDKTYWFKVVFWEKQAETLCTYLHKGSKIGVVGKLTSRDYTDKDGNKRNAVEIVANRFEFLDKKSDARSTNDFSVVDDDGDLPLLTMSGYIKLHRRITEWGWYKDATVSTLFIHLLLTASYADRQYKGRDVKRGSIITTLPELSEQTGLSIKQTRRALDALEKTGEIRKLRAGKGTHIEVLNYAVYQGRDNDRGQFEGSLRAVSGQFEGSFIEEEVKKERKNPPKSPRGELSESLTVETADGAGTPANHSTTSTRFDEFWGAYPRKIGKAAARKAYQKLKPTADLHAKILTAIDTAKHSDQWTKDNGQFIPHPTTWLNQGRWDDELEVKTKGGFKYFD